jgi:hypothetical protein
MLARVVAAAVVRVYYDKLGLKFQTYDQWIASGARIPRILSKPY